MTSEIVVRMRSRPQRVILGQLSAIPRRADEPRPYSKSILDPIDLNRLNLLDVMS